MSDLLCEMNLSDIDLTDDRYRISFSDENITFLARSIKEAGLLCPPTVRQVKDKCIVISGFNRLRALHHNKEKTARVYKKNPEASDYDCLLTAITAVSFQRPLTHFELIVSIRRLLPFLDKKQIAAKSPGIFNMELNSRFVADLMAIGGLPDPALALIRTGHLSFQSAKRICPYDTASITAFLKIFAAIKASSNKQLEIILHLTEIAARDGLLPKDLFNDQEIQAILLDDAREPGEKTALLRTVLFDLRFPALSKKRQMIREKISSVKLGKAIKFLPPENFESQYYDISFTAKNYKEFADRVDELKAAVEKKGVKEIFNP